MEEALVWKIKLRQERLAEYLKGVVVRFESEELSINDAVNAISQLKTLVANLDKEVNNYTVSSVNPKIDIINKSMDIQVQGEDCISKLEAAVTVNKMDKRESSSEKQLPNTLTDLSTTKLPKLELPKFNGDPLKWIEFWDRFSVTVDNKMIGDADKLAYLLSCLEGTAMEAVAGLTTTNYNYSIAIDSLKRRFGSSDNVIDSHYSALNNLPRAQYNAHSCRTTLDEIERHLRILEKLGEPSNNNSNRSLILSKFPERVLHEYHLMKSDSGDNSIDTIRKNLQKVIFAMEGSQYIIISLSSTTSYTTTEALQLKVETQVKSYNKRNPKQVWKRKGSDFVSTPPQKRSRRPCMFCGRINHLSTECREYKSLEDRKKKLQGRCFRCLRHNHKIDSCKSKVICYRCKGNHLQVLCPQPTGKENSKDILPENNECQMSDKNLTTFLQTAVANILNPNNKKQRKGRIVLDSGSQRSYITGRLAKFLALSEMNNDLLLVYTFGSKTPREVLSPATDIMIITLRGIRKQIRVNIVPHITDRLKIPSKISFNEIDLQADDGTAGVGVDLLIGNDYYISFIRENKIKVDENLYMIDTDFGWVLSGRANKEDQSRKMKQDNILTVTTYCNCHNSSCPYFTEPDLPLRNIDIKFLWSLESIGITDSPKTTRQEEAVRHFNDTVRYNMGHYEVKWPWTEYPPNLPTNFGLAYGRLKSLIKRLDSRTMKEYDEILKEQLAVNIIETVLPCRTFEHPLHYLPHHIVKQDGKRNRIVYDASAKIPGKKSLNECLYSGPSMLEDLTALLLRFRIKRVGIVADVEKAFLQVGLQEEDRDVTRFLWLKDINKDLTEDNLLHLRFCRIPFGIISSPFLLTATIRHHMHKTQKDLLKTIADNCYVDNLITGADTLQEAKWIYQETTSTFEELGMNIRDWISNNEDFNNIISTQRRALKTDMFKILGLAWDTRKDTLKLKITANHFKPVCTKREILRTLARVYDPCGFVCPLTLPIKLLFQKICERKIKWDAKLPEDLMQLSVSILENLKVVSKVELPRYIGLLKNSNHTLYELHCFSDASKNAYAAVVYLKTIGSHETCVSFVMGKCHVTQSEDKNNLKMPKLELLGFLIGSRLLKYVHTHLELPIHKQFLWTDSLVVLGWINSDKLLPPFVTNRVKEIKQNHPSTEMLYINTNLNPADVATRPEKWTEKKELWYNAPEFIKYKEDCWPENRYYDNHKTLFSIGEVLEETPEIRSTNIKDLDHQEHIRDGLNIGNQPQTSIQEIIEGIKTTGSLETITASELKRIQKHFFPEETTGKTTNLTRNLDLFSDVDGILRCRGRTINSNLCYDTKYPILLPKDCDLTNSIIKSIHLRNYHAGPTHTLSLVRNKYWIPHGKRQVQKVLRKCQQCVKHGGGPYPLPPAAPLPPERVNYSTPFTFTGVDYLGPLYVNSPRGKEKRWICLFTCLSVRAIHLEVVMDLTAEECLLAIRRFAATRNTPKKIYSDNATYFKLVSEIIKLPFCVGNTIEWKFIPQLAPWHGGFYERLVAIVKHCLKRTLEKHLLNDTKLLTVIKEIEAVVNSRPLTQVGPELIHILRPSDFLSLGECLTVSETSSEMLCEGTTTKQDLIESWKRGLNILKDFKNMFIYQYLTGLRERYQNLTKQPRIKTPRLPKVGDIVQMKSDSKNRENWNIGKITDLIKGADGECRVAKVKAGNSVFIRSVGHLYPLEIGDEELSQSSEQSAESHIPIMNTSPHHMEIDNVRVEGDPSLGELSTQVEDDKNKDEVPLLATPSDPQDIQESTELECSQVPCSQEIMETNLVGDTNDNVQPNDEIAISEISGQVEDGQKNRRVAAVRAREKILEWTRHLLTLLH